MKKVLLAACAVVLTIGPLVASGSPAAADPATAAAAAAYGANADLSGTALIDQAGLAEVTLPPGGDDGPNELLLVPASPIAVSGTAVGIANAHTASDIPTSLEQVAHSTPGPYNVRGVGLTEGLGVLVGAATIPGLPDVGVELVTADAVRGEAVGVCRNGQAVYSANSEIVDLNIGGTDVPLNGPLTDVVDALNAILQPLNAVVDIERNEVVVNANGAAVNALHVTVLGAIGGTGPPLLDLIVGHAQVGGLNCEPATPQCADGQDNDGDGLIDRDDPGCINNGVYDPNDNDERNECVDGVDNDGDGLTDFGNDPGCSSPEDDSEDDGPGVGGLGDALPRTGGTSTAGIALGMAVLAFAGIRLRRRSHA